MPARSTNGTAVANTAGVLVVSNGVRGRVRLQVRDLRNNPGLALALRERLAADDRVARVSPSTLTGNVLVLFDGRRLGVKELRRRVAREIAAHRFQRGSRPAGRIPDLLPASNGTPWHTLTPAEVARSLNDSLAVGLSTEEAERRLQTAGANRLPAPQPKSAFEIIWEQVGSLPVLLLGGAAVVSIATGGLLDGAAILAVIAANAAIGYVTESRVERILASLKEIGVPMAMVRRDGREQVLPRAELVPGDIMLLRPGHDVAADGRVIAADGLQTDESALTGESVPVTKRLEHVLQIEAPVAERVDMVYAGTVVAEGMGEAVVTATGRHTELGRIRALVSEARAPRTPLERQLDETGRHLALASLGLCGALFAVGVARGLGALAVFRTAASLAVAAVPEGLPTVATTTLALGMRRMQERRTLVRRLAAVESLGSTTVICVDKTGTVTENRMTVGRWHVAGRDRLQADLVPSAVDPALERALTVAVLCNEAVLVADAATGAVEMTGSATESALLLAARSCGVDVPALRERYPTVATSPRGDGRNWMGSMHAREGERLIAVKGAPEEVLRGCSRWLGAEGEAPLVAASRRRIMHANDRMAGEGMRVLGFAFKPVALDALATWDNLMWIGLVGLIDPIRPGVREAIAICH